MKSSSRAVDVAITCLGVLALIVMATAVRGWVRTERADRATAVGAGVEGGEAGAPPLTPDIFYRLSSTGIRLGPDDASVTLVTFFNFGCGFCRTFEGTLDTLRHRYPDHFAVIYKHLLSEAAPVGLLRFHLGLICASRLGRADEYIAIAFRNQSRATFRSGWTRVADGLSRIDRSALDACVLSHDDHGTIARDYSEGTALGIASTPTSYLNGNLLLGAIPLPRLDSLIATELRRRRASR